MIRKMQERYSKESVPLDCYLELFDNLRSVSLKSDISSDEFYSTLNSPQSCPGDKKSPTNSDIGVISQIDVLRKIALGKKVIFVDTREPQEYREVHLPGAVLMPLRDVNKSSVNAINHADLIVPYCVKDFRGYEVAKSIKRHTDKNVATLSPHGLKGWLKSNLPVTRLNTEEATSLKALNLCASEASKCLEQ